MTPQQIVSFAKVNSGAAVAILLVILNANKTEQRLERVEQKLFECYSIRMSASNESNEFPDHSEFMPKLAVLPEKKEHETESRNYNNPN